MIRILRYITILFAISTISYSQDTENLSNTLFKNPSGTDFWLCFMKNYKEQGSDKFSKALHLELFITSNENANVVVSVQSIGFKKEFPVPAGTVQSLIVDPKAIVKSSEIIERDHAVHITSDEPITVYALNRRQKTTDTYLGLPTKVLGKVYRVMCYSVSEDLTPQFAIVATEDNTIVKFNPTVETQAGKKPGKEVTVRLHQGDVYQVKSKLIHLSKKKCDLTGTKIIADKKIAVFSGHQCAYVPERVEACNHLVEQMPPVPSWGKHFYLGMLKPRSNYTYRIMANEDSTKIFLDARFTKYLNAGDFYESIGKKPIQVTADRPVLVSQYSQGFRNGDSIGDPMMILVSPTQQFLRKYSFATPVKGDWEHYVNVIVPKIAINTMKLNGRKVDSTMFEPLGISRYAIAYIRIGYGAYVIEGGQPFGMYSYGFGFNKDVYDAYGTIGGQSFLEYVPKQDTIAPLVELADKGNGKVLIFRDDNVDDTGLRDIYIETDQFEHELGVVNEGSPQYELPISPVELYSPSSAKIIVEDMSKNAAHYSLCYGYNHKTSVYEYILQEGIDDECEFDEGYIIGAYLQTSLISHSADFSTVGGWGAPGRFSDATGSGGYFGLSFGKKILNNFVLSARLTIEDFGGTLIAPDSMAKHIRDRATGQLVLFQESRDLTLKGLNLDFAFAGEYSIKRYIYLLGGINFTFRLSKSVDIYKRIITPDNYIYENDQTTILDDEAPQKIETLNTIMLGVFGGIGLKYNILGFDVFLEADYNYYISDMVSDSDWSLDQIAFRLGVKKNIFFTF